MGDILKLSEADFKKIDRFNLAVKGLLRIACAVDPNNVHLDRLRRLISIALEFNPIDPQRIASKYLLKYKDQILCKDAQFFLNGAYNENMRGSEMISGLFDLISGKWHDLSKDEQDEIWKKVEIMVNNSIKWEANN